MFTNILKMIEAYDTVVIHRHTNPDGDAIGSQVGLKYLLQDNYPKKTVWIVGDAPKRYGFVEGSEPDTVPDEVYGGALAIVLDTSAKSLISDNRYERAAASARIDHHIFVETICEEEVTDTSFESCCGLVACLAKAAGWKLTSRAAKALYTGMVTDSGRFRYDSTTAKTHEMAAYLMSVPFDTGDIFRNLYTDEFRFIRLRASFVLKIQLTPRGDVAYIYTTNEEREALGFDTFTISRGMVNTMGEIKGVDIWVNFTETENGVLTEIRSTKHNINQIAVKYGGGGHLKASGCTVENKEMAMNLLKDLEDLAGGTYES